MRYIKCGIVRVRRNTKRESQNKEVRMIIENVCGGGKFNEPIAGLGRPS